MQNIDRTRCWQHIMQRSNWYYIIDGLCYNNLKDCNKLSLGNGRRGDCDAYPKS